VIRRELWGPVMPRLHLPFELDGAVHLILMTQMLALAPGDIGAMVGDAGSERDAIVRAVDLLVTGF
jgi:hypothetical protein